MKSKEYYLNLVKTFKTQARYKKFIWERDLPPLAEVLRELGSWEAAKKFLKENNSEVIEATSCNSQSTFLYLVYFYEEDFYKVGVTTVGVQRRFRGFPTYKLIDKILLSHQEALDGEAIILNKFSDKYTPKNLKFLSGHTECFKSKDHFTTINNLLKGSNMAWTKKEEEELIESYNKGLSVQDISELINRPTSTVANKCARLGLSKMPRWTEKEEEELIALSNEGHSLQRLALRLGRTEGSIKQKISRLLKEGVTK